VLQSVLELLNALWESGIQFIYMLEKLRSSTRFWDSLSQCIHATLDCSLVDNVDAVDENFSLRCIHRASIFQYVLTC
jgi:hypothetical protein